jgi:hypothetical protein
MHYKLTETKLWTLQMLLEWPLPLPCDRPRLARGLRANGECITDWDRHCHGQGKVGIRAVVVNLSIGRRFAAQCKFVTGTEQSATGEPVPWLGDPGDSLEIIESWPTRLARVAYTHDFACSLSA